MNYLNLPAYKGQSISTLPTPLPTLISHQPLPQTNKAVCTYGQ